MFNLAVPFFLPLWRRVAVVTVCVLWGLVELSSGQVFWAIIFWGLGGGAAWAFYTADWSAVAADDDG